MKNELNSIVSALIGHNIGVNHIHTDKDGWHYYIPAKSLQANHPLILNHYRGTLFMVIPLADWTKLENGDITVQDYVDNSVWSYGYYWGGGSMLRGVQWQPFEEKGIHDKKTISRYLTILKCRTNQTSLGYKPSEEKCMSCLIEHCPFSKCKAKCEKASWDNEIKEYDDRVLLFEAVKERIQKRFGLEAVNCYNQDEDTICIFPSYSKDTVNVYLPKKILIDMMYNPGKYNIEETVDSMELQIGIPFHSTTNHEIVPSKRYPVAVDADVQMCYDLWRKECPNCISNWFDTRNTEEVDTSKAIEKHDLNFTEKVVNFFENLF